VLSELMPLHSQLSIEQPGMVQVQHAEMQKEVNFHISALLYIHFTWHVICELEDSV